MGVVMATTALPEDACAFGLFVRTKFWSLLVAHAVTLENQQDLVAGGWNGGLKLDPQPTSSSCFPLY